MLIHADSHVDHGLGDAHRAFLLERFKGRDSFFIETVPLPVELDEVPMALYGPSVGDAPIGEDQVVLLERGNRGYKSRCVHWPIRTSRSVTVIAGPHTNQACILYTAFGGPLAPKEVGELEQAWEDLAARNPRDAGLCREMDELKLKLVVSRAFWAQHALAVPVGY